MICKSFFELEIRSDTSLKLNETHKKFNQSSEKLSSFEISIMKIRFFCSSLKFTDSEIIYKSRGIVVKLVSSLHVRVSVDWLFVLRIFRHLINDKKECNYCNKFEIIKKKIPRGSVSIDGQRQISPKSFVLFKIMSEKRITLAASRDLFFPMLVVSIFVRSLDFFFWPKFLHRWLKHQAETSLCFSSTELAERREKLEQIKRTQQFAAQSKFVGIW